MNHIKIVFDQPKFILYLKYLSIKTATCYYNLKKLGEFQDTPTKWIRGKFLKPPRVP